MGNGVILLPTVHMYPGAEYVIAIASMGGYCWVKNSPGSRCRLHQRQIHFEMSAQATHWKSKVNSAPTGGGKPVGGRYSNYGTKHGGGATFSPPQAQAVKCTIIWDSAAGVYSVSTPYEPNFVEFIKAKIPGNQRAWDPNTKLWTIEETWLEVIQTLATELWGATAVSVTTRQAIEDAERAARDAQRNAIVASLPERERAVFEFVSALPFEAVQAAYRKAALLLHPDRNPVDGTRMAELNAAWSRIEKEFKK